MLRSNRHREHRSLAGQLRGQGLAPCRYLTSVPYVQCHCSGLHGRVGGPRWSATGSGQWPCPRSGRGELMSHGTSGERTISVEGLARVEGEGSLRVEVRDGVVGEVALEIFEPPRYFEAMLVGRNFTEAPDITSRICGICPVAYQMSACNAMEDAFGVSSTSASPPFVVCFIAASGSKATRCTSTCCTRPDFLGAARTPWSWPSVHPGPVERGLDLKRTGNLVMEAVGAGPCTPSTSRSAAFTVPRHQTAIAALCRASSFRRATRPWRQSSGSRVSTFPTSRRDYRFVALRRARPLRRSSPAGRCPPTASTSARRSSPSSSSKSTWSGRRPFTPASADARPISPDRLLAIRSTPRCCLRSQPRPRPAQASAQFARTRSAASSSAP